MVILIKKQIAPQSTSELMHGIKENCAIYQQDTR
jgi:hypothetical protein